MIVRDLNQRKNFLSLCFVFLGMLHHVNYACTTIIVGKSASVDGSIIIARNSDSGHADHAKHMILHPYHEGAVIFHSTKNNFFYDLGHTQYAYSGLPYYDTQDQSFEQVGSNQYGVSISATESIKNNLLGLLIDPQNSSHGITEDSIVSVIMPLVKSARQGIALLGHIIETQGAGEGFGVAIADNKEAWYLETATGHRWVAVRIPDQSYFIAANQARIQEVHLEDQNNYMGSSDLIQFAIQNYLYDHQQEAFNFRHAYAHFGPNDLKYNYPRIAELIRLYSDGIVNYQDPQGDYLTFLTPNHKLSVLDIEKGLNDHYQEFSDVAAQYDPYNLQNPHTLWRPISVFRASHSHVTVISPDKPAGLANVSYIALGMQDLSFYIPFYNGITRVPYAYTMGTDQADEESAFWKFRKLQTLVMLNYPHYAPIVHSAINEYNAWVSKQQLDLEKEYNQTLDPEILNQFTENAIRRAFDVAEHLSEYIIKSAGIDFSTQWLTLTTQNIETEYHFLDN